MDTFTINKGYLSPYFIHENGQCRFENCSIIVLDTVNYEWELTDIINEYRHPVNNVKKEDSIIKGNSGRSVLLFVRSIAGEALARLCAESISKRLTICVVELPTGKELCDLTAAQLSDFCFGYKSIGATIDQNCCVLTRNLDVIAPK